MLGRRLALPLAVGLILCGVNITVAEEADGNPEEIEQLRTLTAYTVEPGELEVDFVPQHLRFDEHSAMSLIIEAEFGLTLHWDVEVELPFVSISRDNKRETGLGDIELESKYTLVIRPDARFALAAVAEISLPIGNKKKGLSKGNPEVEGGVVLSGRLQNLRWHLNAGIGIEQENDETEAELITNLAVVYPLGEFQPMFGLNGEFGETKRFAIVPAIEWEALGLEFGVGFPVGLTDVSEDFGFIGDIEVEF